MASAARLDGASRAPAHPLTLLRGDGIGPEVVDAMVWALDAAGARVAWEHLEVGARALRDVGGPLPAVVLESVRRNRVALKGTITTSKGAGHRSVSVSLRRALGLWGQVRLCRSFPRGPSQLPHLDLAEVPETAEGLFAGVERQPGSPRARELIDGLAADGAAVPS